MRAPPLGGAHHNLDILEPPTVPCQTPDRRDVTRAMSIDPIASRLASHGVAYAPEIAGAARRHSLDPELLAAVAAQETGGPDTNSGRNVVGDSGHGHGIFQIDDRWHTFASTPAAMDPGENADYAAGMLSGLLAKYQGNIHRALSAFNAGSPDATGTQTNWGDGRRLGYADSVMQHYTRLTGEAPPAAKPIPDAPDAGAAIVDLGASPHETAAANVGSLIAALGALQSQAAALPSLPAPEQPPPSQPYQQHVTDYGSLLSTDTDN
jgi:hypothetical protein